MKKETAKKEATQAITVEVVRAKEFEDGVVSFDMKVNDIITIYGCWYREYKTKDGKEGTMISFPSRKGNDDKYYNHVWFKIDDDLKVNIISQLEKMV